MRQKNPSLSVSNSLYECVSWYSMLFFLIKQDPLGKRLFGQLDYLIDI